MKLARWCCCGRSHVICGVALRSQYGQNHALVHGFERNRRDGCCWRTCAAKYVTLPIDYCYKSGNMKTMKTSAKSTRSRDTQRAYEGLRRLITQNQIPAGERLAEVSWSNRLRTSRPAVREAFALLAHEELLARGERGGFFVAKYTEEDLAKMFQARIVLETGALRLMATLPLDEELLDRMGKHCQTMEYLLDHELLLGFCEVDREFHITLVKLTGNEWLVKMHRRTPSSHYSAVPEMDSAGIRQMGMDVIGDHREIYQAIRERRFDDAIAALERHLTVDVSLHYSF